MNWVDQSCTNQAWSESGKLFCFTLEGGRAERSRRCFFGFCSTGLNNCPHQLVHQWFGQFFGSKCDESGKRRLGRTASSPPPNLPPQGGGADNAVFIGVRLLVSETVRTIVHTDSVHFVTSGSKNLRQSGQRCRRDWRQNQCLSPISVYMPILDLVARS